MIKQTEKEKTTVDKWREKVMGEVLIVWERRCCDCNKLIGTFKAPAPKLAHCSGPPITSTYCETCLEAHSLKMKLDYQKIKQST